MDNTEVEIKLQLENTQSLLDFLHIHAEHVKDTEQIDAYYTPAHRNFLETTPVQEWFRLREDGGRYSLNYKNWHYNEDGRAYHCDEYELSIDSKVKAALILQSLNFILLVTVQKKRSVYTYNNYEIALDTVANLGEFVEVEYKGAHSDPDPKAIAAEMKQFIESTGAKIISQDFAGYPIALLKQKV